jgi:hypothetical protein
MWERSLERRGGSCANTGTRIEALSCSIARRLRVVNHGGLVNSQSRRSPNASPQPWAEDTISAVRGDHRDLVGGEGSDRAASGRSVSPLLTAGVECLRMPRRGSPLESDRIVAALASDGKRAERMGSRNSCVWGLLHRSTSDRGRTAKPVTTCLIGLRCRGATSGVIADAQGFSGTGSRLPPWLRPWV